MIVSLLPVKSYVSGNENTAIGLTSNPLESFGAKVRDQFAGLPVSASSRTTKASAFENDILTGIVHFVSSQGL